MFMWDTQSGVLPIIELTIRMIIRNTGQTPNLKSITIINMQVHHRQANKKNASQITIRVMFGFA